MKLVIYDTETEGLNSNIHKILQIAYVVIDTQKNNKIIKAYSSYIKWIRYNINPEAEAVHGLNEQFLNEHGKSFKDVGLKIYPDFRHAAVCGYNVGFDNRFLIPFFKDVGFRDFTFGSVRNAKLKKEKLIDAVKNEKVNIKLVDLLHKVTFPEAAQAKLHDASYDVMLTYALTLKRADKLNLLNK